VSNFFNRGTRFGILAAVLLVGGVLRLYELGALGYAWDEDLTSLAVQGISENGLPLLPSGILYARAMPYHYSAALIPLWTEVTELALRLPGALCSLMSVVLIACIGAALESRKVGLLAAAVLSVSLWEVSLARNARMYPVLTAIVLAFLLAWIKGFLKGSARARWVSIVLLGLAVLTHDLAASLILVYLYPWWGRWHDSRRLQARREASCPARDGRMVFSALLVAGATLAFPRWLSGAVGAQFVTLASQDLLTPSQEGLISRLLSTLGDFIRLPQPMLWGRPGGYWLLGLVLGIGALLVGRLLHRSRVENAPQPWLRRALGVLLLMSLACHQAVAVGIVLLTLAYRDRAPGEGPPWSRVALWGAWSGLGLLAWGLFGVVTNPPDSELPALKQTLLEMMDVPQRLWQFLPELFLILFLVSIGVSTFSMLQRCRPGSIDFLGYIVFVSLVGLGMATSPTRAPRYIAHLNPLLILLGVIQIVEIWRRSRVKWQDEAGKLWERKGTTLRVLATIVFFALLLDVAPPRRLALKLGQSYSFAAPEPLGGPWEGFPYYPDEKSTSLYVATRKRAGDKIIAMNWLSFAAYAGPADYVLRTSNYEVQAYQDNGHIRDIYAGSILIPTLADLRSVIEQRKNERIWLVTSAIEVDRRVRVTADILAFLQENSDKIVYTGRDRRGHVYLFGS
jgi:hypothetical protein